MAPAVPNEEYNLARAAFRAAQESDAARFAGPTWIKAEENYRAGQRAYKEGDYQNAKKLFDAAIAFAEKAENVTRLKKFQTGEGVP